MNWHGILIWIIFGGIAALCVGVGYIQSRNYLRAINRVQRDIEFARRLAASQRDLPTVAAQVLRDNAWKLYE